MTLNCPPNNNSTVLNPVGHFMVACGAILEHDSTGKILILQRNSTVDWQAGVWEVVYGRLAQSEGLEEGLSREIYEETGITQYETISIVRVWHIFRGSRRSAENELIGITYYCKTKASEIILSSEHSLYHWVTVEDALKYVTNEGIRKDIIQFITSKKK